MKQSTDKQAEKKAGKKTILKTIDKHNRRIAVFLLIFAVVMTSAAFANAKMISTKPYAIVKGDKALCYVTTKSNAAKVMKRLVEEFTEEDADLRAVRITADIKTEIADKDSVDADKILSVKDAVEVIKKDAVENDDFDVVIAGNKEEIRTFTPDPVYEKDDSLYAGETYVKVEGKDGQERLYSTYTTTDGEITNVKVLEKEVIDEGTSEVIVKGTLGLPDDADWKTYDGDPVFNNADDLIATCKKYLGAPYKYGGHSLTNGIDCVQYVRQMFAKYGISIPNKHSQIQKVGKGVSLKDAQPGDIVCWSHHVGIYIGNGKVINATRKKGVAISSVHMKKKLITIRRVPRN